MLILNFQILTHLRRKFVIKMTVDDSLYHLLRHEIDTRTANAFPSSDSGLEIRILKQIFTPLEAQIAIQLSALPENINRIHKRVTKNEIGRAHV